MKKITYSLLLMGSLMSISCNDYLDVVPKGDVETIESNFEQRADVERWLKSCYVMYTDMATSFTKQPGFLGADELVGGQYAREQINQDGTYILSGLFIGDGLQMPSNPYGNIWKKDEAYGCIRYCNIFLANVDRCYNLQPVEKKLWSAEIKALKAAVYFELLKRYGSFILMPENISPTANVEEMQQPRATIDNCVKAIVDLCDEAIEVLPNENGKETIRQAYFNKEACATVKAYALLYAASPLFNGNTQMKDFVNRNGEQLFPSEYDKEKWHKAAIAADEAISYAIEGGKALYREQTDKGTTMQNTIFNIQQSVLDKKFNNKESLLTFRRQGGLGEAYYSPFTSTNNSIIYDEYSRGCLAPSMKMVEMFYTEHGLPIEEDKQWVGDKYSMGKEIDNRYRDVVPLNEDVIGLHRRREPRFYADIAADGTYWYRSGGSYSPYSAILVACHQGEDFGSQAKMISPSLPQSLTGYWMKKFLDSTAPFADYVKYEAGSFNQILFRLPELYLMSAEAWNEYLEAPDEHVYNMLDQVRERAGIPKVREAWASYAKNPEKVNTKAGMREIIHREWNIEFAFEGRRFYNLRRWKEAPTELNQPQYGWNILGTDSRRFYNNFEGPIVVWNKRKFTAPRDYFFPIRSEEIIISGCVQNPGWGGKQ